MRVVAQVEHQRLQVRALGKDRQLIAHDLDLVDEGRHVLAQQLRLRVEQRRRRCAETLVCGRREDGGGRDGGRTGGAGLVEGVWGMRATKVGEAELRYARVCE